MPASRLATRFNTRNDVFDSITPNWRVQPEVSAPHGEWKPATWLPVVFTKSNIGAGEDAYVISSGKIVAQDPQGGIVPAGLIGALNQTIGTTVLTYTATDAAWGVTDLVTGSRVAAATSYTALEVAEAIVQRGLIDVGNTTSANPPTTNGHVTAVIQEFISDAIGLAVYDFHVYSGRPEDGDQYYTNYSKQHLVQFVTEMQVAVPHMTFTTAGSDAFDVSVITPTASLAGGAFPADGTILESAGLATWSRYSIDAASSLVAFILDEKNMATNTSRTLVASDVAGVLTSEKSALADVAAEGDFWVDRKVGAIFVHSDTYATLIANNTAPTFTYSYYASSAVLVSEQYIHFVGDGKPGDYISYDDNSNYCVMASADDVFGGANVRSLGRLHVLDSEPKDLLQHVKTAFDLENMSAAGKMPGTATQGFSDKITLSNETVADQLAVITVRI